MASEGSVERRPRRLGCGWFFVIGFALLILVLFVAILVWSIRSSRQLEAELARIKAADEPITPDDLQRWYNRSSADPETARLWLDALETFEGRKAFAFSEAAGSLPIVGDGEGEIPPPGQTWSDLQAAEELLEQYENSLRQLHEAAERGGAARYPTNFNNGFESLFPPIAMFRSGAALLKLQAHVRAHRGDAHGAARSIRTMLMLADSLQQEPITISQLVRTALDGMATDLLRDVLPHVDFSDEDLKRLQDDVRARDYKGGMQNALLGQRVIGVQAIKDPSTFGDEDMMVAPGLPLTRNVDLAFFLGHMRRLIAAMKKPWPQVRQAVSQVNEEFERATYGGSALSRWQHIMSEQLVLPDQTAINAAARGETYCGAADVALGVERFRREHGKLPQKLDELVPKFLPRIPIDPYDGKPLRYVLRKNEYTVYSVGEDGVDDGGQGDENGEPDRVFTVKLRAAK